MAQEEKEDVSFLDGMEGRDTRDISVAQGFIRILHTTSPECTPDAEEYVQGAKPGDFFNTLSRKVYGNQIEVIVLDHTEAWLEFEPDMGPFKGMHQVNSIPVHGDEYGDGLKNEAGNDIVTAYVYAVVLPKDRDAGMLMLSLSGSRIKHARNWNTYMRALKLPSGKPAKLPSSVWSLKTVLNTKQKGSTKLTWYNLGEEKKSSISWVRWINKEEYTESILPQVQQAAKAIATSDYSPQLIADTSSEQAY